MKENVRFYRCPICDNVIGLIDGDMEHIKCCGEKMEQMIANTTDASAEKHVPVCEIVEDELVVKVGEVEHPMEKEHYIMWIAQVTDNRTTRVRLYPEQATETRLKVQQYMHIVINMDCGKRKYKQKGTVLKCTFYAKQNRPRLLILLK